PWYEIQRFDSLRVTVQDQWKRPLTQSRNSFRGNFSAAVTPKLDLSINTGFGTLYNRQPPGDDLIIALLYVGIQNYGFKGPGLDKIVTDANGTQLHDAFTFAPGDIMQNINESRVKRMTSSANAQWRPFSWMQNEATAGIDLAVTNFFQLCKLNECPPANATARTGRVIDLKLNRQNISGKLSSNSIWQATSAVALTTSVGGDYTIVAFDSVNARGVGLPRGATTV